MKINILSVIILNLAVGNYIFANPHIIQEDLVVEGTTELQNDTEVHGDLQVIGSQSQILLGSDGMAAFQSFGYSGTVGFFWDPGQMAIRAGRATGQQWAPPLGLYSAAFGYDVIASGTHSVALNQSTTAGGGSALATGKLTLAGGDASVSMGYRTQAQTFASVVLGSYNELISGRDDVWVPSDSLFVIGNGTAWNNRRNAVTVLKNGKTGIGTSAPQATLDVHGDAHFDGPVTITHVVPQGDLSMGVFTNGPQ